MRIAILGTRGVPAKYGGFETCAEEISVRMAQRGHHIAVYCRKGNYDDSLTTYKGVRLIHLPFIKGKITETFSHTLFSIIHSLITQTDILYVMNAANAPLCIIPKLFGKKIVINVDGLEWKRKKWGKIARSYYLFSEWICTKIADRIVSDAIGIKKYYSDRYHTDSSYIAYGANIEKSKNVKILDEYGLKPDDYFFVASRLEPENNADITIKAMESVNTDKKLVIAGGANYRNKYIKNLMKTKDKRIMFLGPVYKEGHIRELHCSCFAYIHGNEVGGTNPALLKAMGYGNMVFALDNVFNNEVLSGCGISYKKDPADLAEKMQNIVDHPGDRRTYQNLAVQRIREHYTWDKITDKYIQLFSRYI
jgi:glycosyltransferase involved in cell wall biosynthesis